MESHGRPVRAAGQPCPDEIIAHIRSLQEQGISWSVSAREVRGFLGLRKEDFYTRIYGAETAGHPLVSLVSATTEYSQDNIWEFVALVELFCGPQAGQRLEKAGISFSHPEQLEIMGTFLAKASDVVRNHDLEAGEFSAMLRAFNSYERARDVYLEEYFSLPGLVAEAAASYCRRRTFEIPDLAEANVRRLLRFFFRKHVLEPRSIFAALTARLFAQAVAEGYAERPDYYGSSEQAQPGWSAETPGQGKGGESAALSRARDFLELEGRTLTRSLLKTQYKRLMKIYHPDINPTGLRRCQEINSAYALLLAEL